MVWLLLSSLLFTLNNMLWKKYLTVTLTYRLVYIRAIYTSLFLLLLYFFMEGNFIKEATSPEFYIILLSCFLGAIGLYALVTYLKNGRLFNLGYYSMAAIGITGVYSYLFKKDQLLSPWFLPAMLMLATGFIIFINIKNPDEKDIKKSRKDHILLWTMILGFTGAMITQSMAIETFSFVTVAFTQELVILLLAGLASLIFLKEETNNTIKVYSWQPIVMAGVIVAAILTSLAGLKVTTPLTASLVGLLIPLLTFFGGMIFFNEKATKLHYVALLLMLIGCLLLLK